eukprot:6199102-Alexandrium_andersonii.AAC.1
MRRLPRPRRWRLMRLPHLQLHAQLPLLPRPRVHARQLRRRSPADVAERSFCDTTPASTSELRAPSKKKKARRHLPHHFRIQPAAATAPCHRPCSRQCLSLP